MVVLVDPERIMWLDVFARLRARSVLPNQSLHRGFRFTLRRLNRPEAGTCGVFGFERHKPDTCAEPLVHLSIDNNRGFEAFGAPEQPALLNVSHRQPAIATCKIGVLWKPVGGEAEEIPRPVPHVRGPREPERLVHAIITSRFEFRGGQCLVFFARARV